METQNNTITEDYVSFETAQLLKQKGFSVPVRTFYNPKYRGEKVSVVTALINYNADTEDGSVLCSAPTLQMTMKWLREVHKLHILCYMRWKTWKFEIEEIPNCESDYDKNGFASYEQAAEEAIKYCLTNIIK